MNKPNPAIALLGIYAAKKSLDNGTKQYEALKKLGEINESHTRELAKQTELQAEYNDIQGYRAGLDRERNQIELAKLDTLNRQAQLKEIENNIREQDLNLKQNIAIRAELRISIETDEKAIISRQRDCIFNIKKDIEKINSSWDSKVEKYIKLANHLISIGEFGISTEFADSFEDKEVIDSTIEKLNSYLKKVIDQLTEEEIEDIASIQKIFQVDEDRLIADGKFNLKNINKEIRALDREQKNLHKEEESLSEILAELLAQQSKHDLKEPE